MIEKYLRPPYQAYLADPISKAIVHRFSFSPFIVTLSGCFLGLASALFIFLGYAWPALIFLLSSGFCDTLDGTIARMKGCSSPIGTVGDIVCDRVVEAAVVIGLFLYAPETRALLCMLMMTSILLCITSFLVVGIFSENKTEKSFYYSPGIIERGEAFLFFALMIVFPSLFILLGSLFTFLVLLTAAIRLVQFANICTGG
jgi:archaetidylinositol phosphate synthase